MILYDFMTLSQDLSIFHVEPEPPPFPHFKPLAEEELGEAFGAEQVCHFLVRCC